MWALACGHTRKSSHKRERLNRRLTTQGLPRITQALSICSRTPSFIRFSGRSTTIASMARQADVGHTGQDSWHTCRQRRPQSLLSNGDLQRKHTPYTHSLLRIGRALPICSHTPSFRPLSSAAAMAHLRTATVRQDAIPGMHTQRLDRPTHDRRHIVPEATYDADMPIPLLHNPGPHVLMLMQPTT